MTGHPADSGLRTGRSDGAHGAVVITGAAGALASDITDGIAAAGWTVRALDQRPVAARAGVEPVTADIRDAEAIDPALAGAAAVVHLAGIPLEDDWGRLLAVNIDGTYRVLEAARAAGVRRVVLASSIHAAGFQPVPVDGFIEDDVSIRPDTLYGVSKAALEALGSLYADRYGIEVVALRIASRQSAPTTRRTLSTWLSPADATALVLAALNGPAPGFRTVWGVSANTSGYLSRVGGEELGFRAADDSEAARAQVESVPEEADPSAPWLHLLGGEFCSRRPPRVVGQRADGASSERSS